MVSIKELKKNYSDFQLNLSMEIPEGRVTGIIGKNGAGKSTTIKALLGLIKKDGGEITLFGKDQMKMSAADKQNLGVALSDSGFSFELNLEDVIAILRKMYDRFDEQMFRRICMEQKLPFDKKIKEFSTGMKAKLRVLTAISHQAKLLILDEPTSGLDVIARNEVLDMLRQYLQEDEARSMLISSHISSDLEGICDDIYFIHDGKVILHEDTDTILGCYGIIKVAREKFDELDKDHLIGVKEDRYGYTCLTDEKNYYLENYPGLVVENGNIDDMIILMLTGK